MALAVTRPSNVSSDRVTPSTRLLPISGGRKMSLVAEEPSSLSQGHHYQRSHGRRRNHQAVRLSPGRLDENALYVRRMEKLKKTLEGMGEQHDNVGLKPPGKPSRSREFSRIREQNELPPAASRKSSVGQLSPVKVTRGRPEDLTATSDSDTLMMSFRSRDETHMSSRHDDRTANATPVTGAVYQQKHRAKAFLRRKKRQGFLRTLPKLSKFVCILIALWKKHQHRVKEFLDSKVDMYSVDTINDLLFDKTDYTADKQARISVDTKRILTLLPEQRNPTDIKYVEVALRNYPAIAAYPVSIQTLIASKAWYEIYHGRRIIIRQGHVARCFYFILSGKAIVTVMEEGAKTSKTVCYLTKGDSFGEVALINQTHRSATVISEGTVELLVVTDEDYEEIFTSGELTEKYHPFLKSLNFLKGWPLEFMTNNRQKAYITYFRRGAVMAANSNNSSWIFIIKSGSATVLKKLKDNQQQPQSTGEKRRQLDSLSENEHYLFLCNSLVRETKKLTRKEMAARYQRLKELHLGAHVSGTVQAPPIHGQAQAQAQQVKDPIDKVSMANALAPLAQPTSVDMVSKMKKISGWQMGPMVTRTGITPLPPVDESRVTDSRPISGHGSQSGTGDPGSVYGGTSRRMSTDLQQFNKAVEPVEPPDAFVTVQTLIKGDSFGIADLIHGNQPEFSLVSNGAEVVMIDKKMYWEHTVDSQELMRRLKNDILPYPTDEKMQTDLGITLAWEKHKQIVFQKAAKLAKKRKRLNKMKAKGMSVFVDR